MRVVHSIPDFGLGGVQKAGCVLAAAMAKRGVSAAVIGSTAGPRFLSSPQLPLTHHIASSTCVTDLTAAILALDPDVIHLHDAAYQSMVVNSLYDRISDDIRAGRKLVVSTPVFGRPPDDRSLLDRTKTCCVGQYTFYRLCRWLSLDVRTAVDRGIGYVPLTPYEPPDTDVSANDPPSVVAHRRSELGIESRAFVVGRIGRNDPGKWHPATEHLVDALLTRCPSATWLAVGYPQERGAERLTAKWGRRFIGRPETSDYRLLTQILSCMDAQIFASPNGECFASSIAEAAGLGVPTIALITPLKDNGQAEQVIEGVSGTLVTSMDGAVDVVGRWMNDPQSLTRLKQATQSHALQHWHTVRVTDDLLSLYRYWMEHAAITSPTMGIAPPYIRTMIDEASEFARSYRPRILKLLSGGPWRWLGWRVLLMMVEWWPVFKIGRFVKRLKA